MKITIVTIGSRGDIQPFLALGVRLSQAGHQVKLATHETFGSWIKSYGLDFAGLEGNPQEWLESEAGKQIMESANNPLEFIHLFGEAINPMIDSLMTDAWAACQGADAIISHCIVAWVQDLARKLNVPYYMAAFSPLSPTTKYPMSLIPRKSLGGLLNYLSYPVSHLMFWQLFRSPTNKWLKSNLDIPPHPVWEYPNIRMRREQVPLLYAYSSAVLPRPDSWSKRIHITGYWYLESPSDWQAPQELLDFLAAGSPPIYIGFGSMKSRNPERLTEIALKALAKTKQRGILLTGWGGITNADLPDEVLKIDSVPHNWLFPQYAAVVHHGGAGTTAVGLRAGVPTIIVPFLGDQPFWGHRLVSLGVGTKPIPHQDLTEDQLAQAIATVVHDPAFAQRARNLSQQIKAEDGVGNGVKAIEEHLNSCDWSKSTFSVDDSMAEVAVFTNMK